ncbi:uncharacterized protein LOC134287008 [Aedes albopictus]|uniref:Secreted protein n=1 Tax=Aedes albopictus TaxID=7160 RepID=A0ABM1Y1B1_AEDAL|nr:uncharacterized protein LOC109622021 [Aedes albopictus]
MKLLQVVLVLVFVAIIAAKVPHTRQSSLNVLAQVKSAIPSKRSRSSQQTTEDVLNNFFRSVLTTQTEAVHMVLAIEDDLTTFGESIEYWCWEYNALTLESTVRWIGGGYSDCLDKLDTSVAELLAEVNSGNHDQEVDLSQYQVFALFRKSNIISNPEAIGNNIASIDFGITKDIPELGGELSAFENNLNEILTAYSKCLTQKFISQQEVFDNILKTSKLCADID